MQRKDVAEQTIRSPPKTTAEIMQQLVEQLPTTFAEEKPEMQLHYLVKAANEILDVPGEWVLINGNMTLIELLKENTS